MEDFFLDLMEEWISDCSDNWRSPSEKYEENTRSMLTVQLFHSSGNIPTNSLFVLVLTDADTVNQQVCSKLFSNTISIDTDIMEMRKNYEQTS